ncbi:serine hydrolase domain-containing protein [Algoriphagus marinus]|uniref:serine hydrolase domain-containing protein n=1 Tax=Algoriphagus marinus TaxID=1925762 RepID=UPI00158800EA|nr:serine hydrolase domain-containing protein [Algoriphagus marinus]
MNFHKLIYFSLIITISCSCNVSDKQKPPNRDYQEFDVFFQSIQNFSGNALVAIDGESIYSKSFGYASRELLVENTIDTKFRIGSISKPITAIAVMILVEKRLIDVNEHLATYISDIPITWKDITIHQLLTHTSGLAFQPEDWEPKHDLTLEEIFEIYKNHPLAYVSGTTMNYSNMGYFVLSILIEKVSNMPFESFIQEEIFEKLGMINSGGDYPNRILMQRAKGYEVKGDGKVENADFDNMLLKRGAGNMYSTVEDLLKLDKAFSSNILLKEETLAQMMTPYTTDIDMGKDINYGYGLDIVKNDSINMIFHTGGVLGFDSMFYVFPDEGIVIIACANTTKLNRDWRTDFQKLVYKTITTTDN